MEGTIETIEFEKNDNVFSITTVEGDTYKLYGQFCCCESLWCDSIEMNGSKEDYIGQTINEASNFTDVVDIDTTKYDYCETSCSFILSTTKGDVTFQLKCVQNGYYSPRFVVSKNGEEIREANM